MLKHVADGTDKAALVESAAADGCRNVTVSGGVARPRSRAERIRAQVEYYFMPANLVTDQYLRTLLEESPGGLVPVEEICAFPRMTAMRATGAETATACAASEIVEVVADGESSWLLRPRPQPPPPSPSSSGPPPGGVGGAASIPPPRPAPAVQPDKDTGTPAVPPFGGAPSLAAAPSLMSVQSSFDEEGDPSLEEWNKEALDAPEAGAAAPGLAASVSETLTPALRALHHALEHVFSDAFLSLDARLQAAIASSHDGSISALTIMQRLRDLHVHNDVLLAAVLEPAAQELCNPDAFRVALQALSRHPLHSAAPAGGAGALASVAAAGEAGSAFAGAAPVSPPKYALVAPAPAAVALKRAAPSRLPTLRRSVLAPPHVQAAWPCGIATVASPMALLMGPPDSGATFSVMTYNVLADALASADAYPYTPTHARAWPYRRALILREITHHRPSIVCLQELQSSCMGWGVSANAQDHAAWFRENLAALGYDGVYRVNADDPRMSSAASAAARWPRLGVALFWQKATFEANHGDVIRVSYSSLMYDACGADKAARRALCLWQGAVVAMLKHKALARPILAATTHISCKWQLPYIQIMQAHACMRQIEAMLGHASALAPIVLCGDFNAGPGSGLLKLITTGELEAGHADLQLAQHPPEPVRPVRLPFPHPTHRLPLRSAYAAVLGEEPPFTNYVVHGEKFSETLDYIFYTPAHLTPVSVLDVPGEHLVNAETALPNSRFPSDHLPLLATFALAATPPAPAGALDRH